MHSALLPLAVASAQQACIRAAACLTTSAASDVVGQLRCGNKTSVRSYASKSPLFRVNDLTKGKKKIIAVLYDAGPVAREQPKLLGCTENALGLRDWLKGLGHEFVVTSSKEGPGNELDKHLPDADIVITTPFHPGYITRDRIQKAKKLKLCLTAGIGSDHVDLPAAAEAGITVAEVTGSNVVSVAEHAVMMMLALIRNYMPAYKQVVNGEWDVAPLAARSYDLENKVVGTFGCGRIGQRILKRLHGFDCKELLYHDYARMSPEREKELKCRFVPFDELISTCDIVNISAPLHEGTKELFNKDVLRRMKKGAYLVNTARGRIVHAEDLAQALKEDHLAGYAGDVWYPQPAPKDHPWRTMPNHAMTPHMSGTTLDAQARYAAGTKEILRRSFEGEELNLADVIVKDGVFAPQYDKSSKKHSLEHEKGWETFTSSFQ